MNVRWGVTWGRGNGRKGGWTSGLLWAKKSPAGRTIRGAKDKDRCLVSRLSEGREQHQQETQETEGKVSQDSK